MKYLLVFVSGFILAIASPQRAGAVESARELVNQCQKIGSHQNVKRRQITVPNTPGALQCVGYMQAIQNFLVLVDQEGDRIIPACAPEETTLLQLINSFLAYSRKHPDELDRPVAVVVIKAMQEAYPCVSEAKN